MVKIKVQDKILVASAFTLCHLLERDSSFELDFLGYDQNSFLAHFIALKTHSFALKLNYM